MKYNFIGRNLDITDAMQSYAEDKFDKLDHLFNQIIDAKVVMSYNQKGTSEPARVEVQLNLKNTIIRVEEDGVDSYAAIDTALDKLERQLKRYKGRFEAQRSRKVDGDIFAPEVFETTITDEEDIIGELVRTKSHTLRPMAPEDALIQMEALNHNFYLFKNLETDKVSVVYQRHDGNYGLIQPRFD